DMPTMMETFPDATIVHCHRDPRQVIPSFAALISAGRRIGSDHVDPVEVGHDMLRYWADQLDRYLEIRRQHPKDAVLDLRFDEIRKDVVGVVERIYAKAGRPLTPEAIAAFREHERSRPEHHFGSYDYNAESHGLSLAAIDDRFSEYCKTFSEYL
uniref:sulfotransferase family protein n=1 Tax=Nevskia sp. TaxID=1929292 RepID=UPI0025F071FB